MDEKVLVEEALVEKVLVEEASVEEVSVEKVLVGEASVEKVLAEVPLFEALIGKAVVEETLVEALALNFRSFPRWRRVSSKLWLVSGHPRVVFRVSTVFSSPFFSSF